MRSFLDSDVIELRKLAYRSIISSRHFELFKFYVDEAAGVEKSKLIRKAYLILRAQRLGSDYSEAIREPKGVSVIDISKKVTSKTIAGIAEAWARALLAQRYASELSGMGGNLYHRHSNIVTINVSDDSINEQIATVTNCLKNMQNDGVPLFLDSNK